MKKIVLIGLFCFFALTTVSFAREPMDGVEKLPPGKWWTMPGVAEKLSLTNDEMNKLDDIYKKAKRLMITLKSELEIASLDLEETLDAGAYDSTAALEKFKKVQDSRDNLAMERFKYLLEVYKILGQERVKQLKTVLKENRPSRKGGKPPIDVDDDDRLKKRPPERPDSEQGDPDL